MSNQFMQPSAPPPIGGMGPAAQGQPLGPPGGAQQPQQPPAAPPSAAQIEAAKSHLSIMVGDLQKLTAIPAGRLTKKDVFETASDMIAKGAFPTPTSKQALIKEMADMPDEDHDIRKVIGAHLLRVATNLATIEHMG